MNWLLFWRPPAMFRECIVNIVKDDSVAYRGVLFSHRSGWLTFKNVWTLRPGVEPTKFDGELVIHRERVDFLQVMP